MSKYSGGEAAPPVRRSRNACQHKQVPHQATPNTQRTLHQTEALTVRCVWCEHSRFRPHQTFDVGFGVNFDVIAGGHRNVFDVHVDVEAAEEEHRHAAGNLPLRPTRG